MYNGFNQDDIITDTLLEMEQRKKQLKKTFSRIFIGLCLYLIISFAVTIAVNVVCKKLLSEDELNAFYSNNIITLAVNAGVQYLIALPVFLLVTASMKKSEVTSAKSKLSIKDMILLVCMSYTAMYAGSLIGTQINSIIGAFTGNLPQDDVTAIVSSTPVWAILLFTCVLAPIFEELVFRKVMIDRLSVFGDRSAIVFSAIAFGLFHGNLYQFFYAAFVGLILGFVYTKTRRLEYSVVLHMIINILGSVATLPFIGPINEYNEIMEIVSSMNGSIEVISAIFNYLIVSFYDTMQLGLLVGGIIAFVHYIRNRKINVSNDKEIYIPDKEIIKNGTLNVGVIAFIVLSVITMILSII